MGFNNTEREIVRNKMPFLVTVRDRDGNQFPGNLIGRKLQYPVVFVGQHGSDVVGTSYQISWRLAFRLLTGKAQLVQL